MAKKKRLIFHSGVLNKDGLKILHQLPLIFPDHFYMAGGTALSFLLGHRISYDLDFFSKECRLEDHERIAMIEKLKLLGDLTIRMNQNATLHVTVNHTAISFFHYPYPLIKRLYRWNDITIASMEDIGAMKLSAVIGRGAKKDFIDLYFIAKKIGLKALFGAASKKFRDHVNFTASEALHLNCINSLHLLNTF